MNDHPPSPPFLYFCPLRAFSCHPRLLVLFVVVLFFFFIRSVFFPFFLSSTSSTSFTSFLPSSHHHPNNTRSTSTLHKTTETTRSPHTHIHTLSSLLPSNLPSPFVSCKDPWRPTLPLTETIPPEYIIPSLYSCFLPFLPSQIHLSLTPHLQEKQLLTRYGPQHTGLLRGSPPIRGGPH